MPIKKSTYRLTPQQLYRRCNVDRFKFKSSNELKPLTDPLGQTRAIQSLKVGLGVAQPGYNLFVLGPSGLGKRSLVKRHVQAVAEKQPAPNDWCYVYNFDDARNPKAIMLPAGQGKPFAERMSALIEELHAALPAALESEEFRTKRDTLEHELREQNEKALEEIRHRAKEKNIILIQTPTGIGLAPAQNGELLKPEEFNALSAERRQEIQKDIESLQQALEAVLRKVPQIERERHRKVRELTQDVIRFTVQPLIHDIREHYLDQPKVIDHLTAVEEAIINSPQEFIQSEEEGTPPWMRSDASRLSDRYKVNVIIDHSGNHGAPVIEEAHPTYSNLIGRIEHRSLMGNLVTDFTLIMTGALHQANGGYLLVDARQLLLHPFAWEGLKQSLRTRSIQIQSLGQQYGFTETITLTPEPIPLDIKIILFGDRTLYYLLCAYDPEFNDLFKIAADFSETIEWSSQHELHYARLVATVARENKLRPLNKSAIGRVIEHSARLAGDAEKLTIRVEQIADLLREADFWCATQNKKGIDEAAIEHAVETQIFRHNRIEEHVQKETLRETLIVETKGERVGQINGLSVVEIGGYAFGRPTRITATVRLGKGEVIDIEREVSLGGPIHSKGVLILSGFLGARFGQTRPLALSARLVFEQSYGEIDGDSASSTELYALLSALAELPLRQGVAVTGSVNQHGEVQAIGGVNEKIEGFFALCTARGLTGTQGVMIPRANVKHLMLKRDVVSAVQKGRFHVYAVSTIDEGIEILSGVTAGIRDREGRYAADSVMGRVYARLDQYANAMRQTPPEASDNNHAKSNQTHRKNKRA